MAENKGSKDTPSAEGKGAASSKSVDVDTSVAASASSPAKTSESAAGKTRKAASSAAGGKAATPKSRAKASGSRSAASGGKAGGASGAKPGPKPSAKPGPKTAQAADSSAAKSTDTQAQTAAKAPSPAGAAAKDAVSATEAPKEAPAKAATEGTGGDTPKGAAKPAGTEMPRTETSRSSTGAASTGGSSAPRDRAVTPDAPRKGGFFPTLLGGALAAAIGFGAAYYVLPEMGIMTRTGAEAESAAAALDAQAQRIEALEAQIADLPAPEAPDLGEIEDSQQALQTAISDLGQEVSDLSARIDGIETQPAAEGAGISPAQLAALRDTLESQGAQLEELTKAAEERDNEARAAAQAALRRAALARIATALDTGSEFTSVLGDLERTGLATPDALQEVAESGAPTAGALRDGFAPAARAALNAARDSGAYGGDEGMWSFMSDQLGVRSLERQEGPGTDAILSRVEDELRKGNLDAALTEYETLPEPAKTELSNWADAARARMRALAAHDALAAQLN